MLVPGFTATSRPSTVTVTVPGFLGSGLGGGPPAGGAGGGGVTLEAASGGLAVVGGCEPAGGFTGAEPCISRRDSAGEPGGGFCESPVGLSFLSLTVPPRHRSC